MKEKHWILLFVLVLGGHITSMQVRNEELQMVFKPLIMTVLIGYFDSRISSITRGLAKWVLFAMLFSMMGDVLLLFADRNELFFLLGLSSFLLAHIFYIIFFHRVKGMEKVQSKGWTFAIVAVYYAGLIYLLAPYLKDMKVPVLVYGIVISTMFMLAMHMLYIRNKIAGKWMMTGALLFVISDSVLAVNKFYQPFDMAGVIIMLTYGAAQFSIIKGAADYLTTDS
ncbi:MAG: lysoplasmalogenase [Chitinophagaceae bacterium]|nr:lysoplasmalogenase [Chitinophagaceae bacterium]